MIARWVRIIRACHAYHHSCRFAAQRVALSHAAAAPPAVLLICYLSAECAAMRLEITPKAHVEKFVVHLLSDKLSLAGTSRHNLTRAPSRS